MDEYLETQDMMEVTLYIGSLDKGYMQTSLKEWFLAEADKANKIVLDEAIKEKRITERTISSLMKKYDAKREDISQIFKVFYEKALFIDDGDEEKRVVIVTMKKMAIWRMKDYLKKKYNFIVMTPEEAAKNIEDTKKTKSKVDTNYIG